MIWSFRKYFSILNSSKLKITRNLKFDFLYFPIADKNNLRPLSHGRSRSCVFENRFLKKSKRENQTGYFFTTTCYGKVRNLKMHTKSHAERTSHVPPCRTTYRHNPYVGANTPFEKLLVHLYELAASSEGYRPWQ